LIPKEGIEKSNDSTEQLIPTKSSRGMKKIIKTIKKYKTNPVTKIRKLLYMYRMAWRLSYDKEAPRKMVVYIEIKFSRVLQGVPKKSYASKLCFL